MVLGPIFVREAATAPRQPRHYLVRVLYVTCLLLLMCTAWLYLAGTQIIRNVGDMARFGAILFQILSPLQLALITFLAALGCASAVSVEKDRRTFVLLLLTRMTNSELVLGKLFASLLNVGALLLAALPVFALSTLFGGVSGIQILRVYAVTLATALVAGSLGTTLALWREKTFQTLALTTLVLVLWVGSTEAVIAFRPGDSLGGMRLEQWITGLSPVRAMAAALEPSRASWSLLGVLGPTGAYVIGALTASALFCVVAIARVRIWNPSREVRPAQRGASDKASIWGVKHDLAREQSPRTQAAETARAGHVDARVRGVATHSRRVWDHPILWRETRTWAYGRKVLIIRLIYLLLFALAGIGVHATLQAGPSAVVGEAAIVPVAARVFGLLFVVSLVMVNALAVTSITNERDGQALDLLLATDLSPREFVFGKLLGVLWVTKEMVLLPMLLCVYYAWRGGMGVENACFVLGGAAVMNLFVATLGIHCGMTYANSRSAVGTSLGTVFFLFLGVVTCMIMMIRFSGSFHNQLAPFLAFILGGGLGLYVALGHRNPSAAIATASLLLPFATFFAITSALLRNRELTVFVVTSVAYGFTVLAMLVPAIGEFDIAMGRTKAAGDE